MENDCNLKGENIKNKKILKKISKILNSNNFDSLLKL
jgi:hypothetical protein